MWRVYAILLVALAPIAAADRVEKPRRDCKPAGGVLFEVAQRADRKAKLTTATTRLFENGAWRTEIFDVDGKLARSRSGCLGAADVDSIRKELRSANWTSTRASVTCRADQPRFTLYQWKARLLYTERTCNVEALDDESRHALDIIELHLHAPVDLDRGGVPCIDNPLARGCN